MEVSTLANLLSDWIYGGVNIQYPSRNGGKVCLEHVSPIFRLFETSVAIAICILALFVSRKISRTKNLVSTPATKSTTWVIQTTPGKIGLLLAHTFVFGMEVGFKFSSKSLIFLLNPCNITTIIQVTNGNKN